MIFFKKGALCSVGDLSKKNYDFVFAGKRTEVEQALCEQVSGQVRLRVQKGVRSKEASGF
jgi:hypothetical protein